MGWVITQPRGTLNIIISIIEERKLLVLKVTILCYHLAVKFKANLVGWLVIGSLLLVALNVAIRLGVDSTGLATAFARVVKPVLVGPSILGRVSQSVCHRALGH